jgi:hypothetical protein
VKRLIVLLALLVVAGSPSGVAEASTGSAVRYKECGRASVGYTSAYVYGYRVQCQFARTLVRLWTRKINRIVCDENNNYCEVVHVRAWRCVKGGGEGLVRLRCVAGRKRVRAVWGD